MIIFGIIPADRGTTMPVKAGFIDGTDMSIYPTFIGPYDIDAFSAPTVPSVPAIAGGTGAIHYAFGELFYFRIWPIPAVIDVQNPKRNIPIPFQIWNAFLAPINTMNNVVAVGSPGVTIDLVNGTDFLRLELKDVTAIIDDTAPFEIDITYTFTFDFGGTVIRLLAVLADILPFQGNEGIVEELEWLTDVQTNWDGTENRIALRMRPRRTLEVEITLLDDVDRKLMYDKLFKTANLDMYIGSYQYQSRLKAATVIADNKLYTNVRRADLRAGESVMIIAKGTNEQFLFEVDQVFADHVTITTAFSQVIPKDSMVCAAFTGRKPNKSSLQMNAIDGNAKLKFLLTDSRPQVAWPNSGVAVPTFYGKTILLKNPLADGETPEIFDVGLETIDNQTGNPAYYSSWNQPFVEGNRKYLIQTLWEVDALEEWRSFLDAIRGQQKTFYTPTYRKDLVYAEGGIFIGNQIEVVGTEYASLYFPNESYRGVQIVTDVGTYNLKVSDAEIVGGNTVVSFVDPITDDISSAIVERISYIMLVRLGSDKVTLTHSPTHTMLELALRMAAR